jgi:hypothetical protein
MVVIMMTAMMMTVVVVSAAAMMMMWMIALGLQGPNLQDQIQNFHPPHDLNYSSFEQHYAFTRKLLLLLKTGII